MVKLRHRVLVVVVHADPGLSSLQPPRSLLYLNASPFQLSPLALRYIKDGTVQSRLPDLGDVYAGDFHPPRLSAAGAGPEARLAEAAATAT